MMAGLRLALVGPLGQFGSLAPPNISAPSYLLTPVLITDLLITVYYRPRAPSAQPIAKPRPAFPPLTDPPQLAAAFDIPATPGLKRIRSLKLARLDPNPPTSAASNQTFVSVSRDQALFAGAEPRWVPL